MDKRNILVAEAEQLAKAGDWGPEAIEVNTEILRFGVAAREGSRPDYSLAIAAFRQAFRLDRSRYDVIVRLAATHRA